MAKEQDFGEVAAAMSSAKDALLAAYNDLGVEMGQGGTASKARIKAVKEALRELSESLPHETRKKLADLEAGVEPEEDEAG